MRFDRLLVRVLSVFAIAIFIVGGVSAQKHGKKGDRGDDDRGGERQKHDRGGDRGDRGGRDREDRGDRKEHGDRGGEDRGNRRLQDFGGGRENKHYERQQRNDGRQWQRVERQQRVYVPQPQRQVQQVYIPREHGEFRRQQRDNWEQMRRGRNREGRRNRDHDSDDDRGERREERDASKFARKQQHFEEKRYRREQERGRDFKQYRSDDDRRSRHFELAQPRYQEYRRGRQEFRNDPIYRQHRTSRPDYREYRNYPRTNRTFSQPDYSEYRSYQREYRTFSQPDYGVNDRSQLYTPYRGYLDQGSEDSGNGWTQQLIRSVIASFFSNGADGGYYDDNTYSQYGQPYDAGYDNGPQYDYYPSTQYTFGYAPTQAYYEPATYYGYDEYAQGGGMPYDALLGSLPYGDVQDIYSGGLACEMIQRALGTGYYQGLLEGQQARQLGWGDQYYSDPYLYEEAIYDPYSTSIGDSRRHFSEGYEMGYQDALSGQDEFDLPGGGEVDLVSLLLGSVLSLRG